MAANKARIVRQPWALVAAIIMALVVFTLVSDTWGAKTGQSVDEDPGGVPPDAGEPHARSVALGAYIYQAPEDPTKIDEFAEMVGRRPSIVMWYQDWFTPGVKEFDPARMDEVVARGAMPMVTWEPADWVQGTNQPQYALKTIIAGDHDEHVRQWARDAAAWGKPFYVRFAHEMNGNWYPWSPGVNGNESPEEYVAAWRHVHDIFEEEGATNVRWVWNPDLTDSDRLEPIRLSYASLYPGDEYVDWVAIDAYNWGTSQPEWSSWQTFPEIFEASYEEMDALNDKPMMVGEMASAESGGNKAAWIRQTFLSDIPSRYPQVRAVIWFHRDNVAAGQADWRVNSSEDSLEAYREVAAASLYQGQLPPSGLLDLDTDIVSGPPEFSDSPVATFQLFSNHQPPVFECSLDDAAFSACNFYIETSTTTYTGLGDGSHTFRVRAIDAAGNPDPTPATWTWTVQVPPTVDRVVPSEQQTGVLRTTNVSATFSEEMDANTLKQPDNSSKTFKLIQYNKMTSNWERIPATVSVKGNRATLDPYGAMEGTMEQPLAANSKFRAIITTGAKDAAGNPLARKFVWIFTTGE